MKRKGVLIISIMTIVISMGFTGCQVETGSSDNVEPNTMNNVTRVPTGITKKIALKSEANGKYICADLHINSYGPLFANRDEALQWETFDFIDMGNNYFALRSYATGKYVSAEKNGIRRLIADANTIGDTEIFKIYYSQQIQNGWTVNISYPSFNKYIRFDTLCPSEGQEKTGMGCLFDMIDMP
jgi:hypothetical protein